MSRVLGLGLALSISTAVSAVADVIMDFNNTYGLDRDVVGGTSTLLTDPATGLAATITTRALSPSGSHLHVDFGLFGIANVPGRADNGFDLGESWTFDLNAPILFNSIRFESSVPPPAPGMQVRSDAWRGLSLIGDPGNAAFDSTAGSFTFFATATSGVTMNFPTMSDNGPLTVAPGTDITFSYLGTSPTAIRVMDFAVVPEPSTCYVLLLGFVALIWRNARRMKLGYQDQPEQS